MNKTLPPAIRLSLPPFLALALLLASWQSARAGSCTTNTDGNWHSTAGLWSCSGLNSVPNPDDDVFIDHLVDLTGPVTVRDLSISASGVLDAGDDISLTGNWVTDGFFWPNFFSVTFTGSGDQTISGSGDLRFNDLVIDNDHATNDNWVIVQDLIEIEGAVTIAAGAGLDVQNDRLSFADAVNPLTNLGWLKITKTLIASGSPVTTEFPQYNAIGYRGVDITTTDGLGTVTAVIQGNASSCLDGPTNYALRCFTLTRSTMGGISATVRLWALTSELNGLAESDLAAFRYTPPTWLLLTPQANGNDGGSYAYGQGVTSDFSSFLLGNAVNQPTAVRLAALSAQPSNPTGRTLTAALGGLAGLLAAHWLWARKKLDGR